LIRPPNRLRRHDGGATVIEFALVLPLFLMVVIGGMYLSLLAFAYSSMQYATQAGARCASVNSTTCGTATTTVSYTRNQYLGPNRNAIAITTGSGSCGHIVSATMTYGLNTGISRLDVPLAATSCFP
jgi:Flp pilus assembly protein TadG